MPQWTTTQRYAPYESYTPATLSHLVQAQRASRWHLGYHIQPTSGLINDPNGFAFFDGQWQLFCQRFPFGPVHGLKSWSHLTSPDLAHWQHHGLALRPHAPYTTHGVYSGSALPVGDRLFLMYTGNVRTQDGGRISTQLGAWMDRDGKITELDQPLISEPPQGYTAHFRDPQILEHDGVYYALLGAQREDLTGHILLYEAPAPTGPWSLIGPLDIGQRSLGYMIECPNLAFVGDQVALIFCPQGLDPHKLPYQNIYPNTVIIAKAIDFKQAKLIAPGPLHLLDHGFDQYAAHVVNGPDHQAYLISWLGLPEVSYPTDAEGWQGCYSLVKQLDIQNGHLYQRMVDEPLIGAPFDPLNGTLEGQEKLIITLPAHTSGTIRLGRADEALSLSRDASTSSLVIDRSQAGVPIDVAHGTMRTLPLDNGSHTLTLWLDHSSFELQLDEGESVASGRIFPRAFPWRLKLSPELEATAQAFHVNSADD